MIRLTLDQIEVLEVVARLGSFAAAARDLHRVPSAITYAMSSLEKALGVELFDRSGHRVRMTPAGRRVLEQSRRVLFQARRLEAISDELNEGWEPRLSIVLDGLLPMSPVFEALRRFGEHRPPTRVRLKVEYLGGVRERFDREGAQLMAVLDFKGEDSLRAQPLPPVELVLLARVDHPVHRLGGRLDRMALSEFVELSVEDSATEPGPRDPRLHVGGAQVFFVSDFHSKLEGLRRGIGFGWMPRHLVGGALERGELVPVPFEEGSRFVFEPRLVHRADTPLGRGAQLFADLLVEESAAQGMP